MCFVYVLLYFIVIKCSAWQLVSELCESTKFPHSALPSNWCSTTVPRCEWQNITCNSNDELLSLQLFNVPLNIPLPDTIDAPGPAIRTLKLVNCGLKGTVPRTIDQVSSLKILDLSNNELVGDWPWTMVSFMEEFNVANNKLYGKANFNSLMFERQWVNMTVLNIANNKFTEEWQYFSEEMFPKMLYFNIENNQFSGEAPSMRGVRQYRIGGNFFTELTGVAEMAIRETDARTLMDCDMAGVPFRNPPPSWLKPIAERCHYRYDPSNPIYKLKDFTINPVTATSTTTNTSKETTSSGSLFNVVTSSSASMTKPTSMLSMLFSNDSVVLSSCANKTVLSLTLFCFVLALY